MDLIGALVSQVGVDSNQAQALAGGVLGAVKSALEAKAGPSAASELAGAVPELGAWQAKTSELLGGGGGGGGGGGLGGLLGGALGGDAGGGLGGLLGGALGGDAGGGLGGLLGGALGGAQSAAGLGAAAQALGGAEVITGLLGKLNLSPALVGTIAPLVLSFLQSRVPPGLLGTITQVMPLLSGGGAAGGLGDLVGGLFGKK